MKNAMQKLNMSKALVSAVFAALLFVIAPTASAQYSDYGGYADTDYGSSYGGYADTGYSSYGGYDDYGTVPSSYGGYYDNNYSSSYGGYADTNYASSYGGYADTDYASSYGGYADTNYYPSYGGYADTNYYSSYGGYADTNYAPSYGGYADTNYAPSYGGYADTNYASTYGGYADTNYASTYGGYADTNYTPSYGGYADTGNQLTYATYGAATGGTYTGGYNNNDGSNQNQGYGNQNYGQYYGNNNGCGGNCGGYNQNYPNNQQYPQEECQSYDECCDYYNNCDNGCQQDCGGCGSHCFDDYDDEDLDVVCIVSDSNVEEDETVTFTARTDFSTPRPGDSGNISYSWSGDVSGSGRSVSRSFGTDGTKRATVTVRSHGQVASAQCRVEVEERDDLDAECEADDNQVEKGETVVWSVDAEGGDGHYTYSWSGDVSGNGKTERDSYSSTGTKTAHVRVTSDGHSVTRTCTTRVVNDRDDNDDDDLEAVCDVTPSNPDRNETVTWRVRVSGGDGDYNYKWTGAVSGSNRTETARYSSTGRKEATVKITSDGDTLYKTCSITVDDNRSNSNNSSVITLVQNPTTPPPGNLSSGVFLSDLPYTGITDNLKVLLFFGGLVLWSAVIAYVFYKRNAEKKAGKKISHKEMIAKFKADNLARKNLAV